MAILNRRGNNTDFDPNKLLAGEFAYVLDKKELYYCYSPGNVKRLVTSDDVNEILNSSESAYAALQKLLADLEGNPSQVTNILNNIVSLQNNKLDKTGDGKDNIETFTIASTDTDIVSGEKHSVIFGKILKSINIFRTNITNIITNIGTLASLLTTDKTSLVEAINELVNGKFNKANIANNVITTVAGLALDARQGKALQEQITAQNNNLVDINSKINGYVFKQFTFTTNVSNINEYSSHYVDFPLDTNGVNVTSVGTFFGSAINGDGIANSVTYVIGSTLVNKTIFRIFINRALTGHCRFNVYVMYK